MRRSKCRFPRLELTSLMAFVAASAGALAGDTSGPTLAFVENGGQEDDRALYRADGVGTTTWLTDDGFRMIVRGEDAAAAIGFSFEGASEDVVIEPEDELPGRVNVIRGADSDTWRGDLRRFGSVRYRGLRDGVDLRMYGIGARLEYDVILNPGADAAAVTVRVDGARSLSLDDDGILVIDTDAGPVRHVMPGTFIVRADGSRVAVDARVRLLDERRFGFVVDAGPEDHVEIDPGLAFSTYLGGPQDDVSLALAVDAPFAYVVGYNIGGGFPTTTGALDLQPDGQWDAVVSKVHVQTGQLVFSTYLGGNDIDSAHDVLVLPSGEIAIAGVTFSYDFPTTGGVYQPQQKGNGDAYVSILSADGASLVRSTLIGGGEYDAANALALHPATGRLAVVGRTNSANFPKTAGAGDLVYGGTSEGFLSILSADLSTLHASTFLGGAGGDEANVVRFGNGAWYVAGDTHSSDFPTTAGAFDTTIGSTHDAFVARLSDTGAILAATFLGGSSPDELLDLVIDSAGAIHAVGSTFSTDLPVTADASSPAYNGGFGDSMMVQLDPNLQTLGYATYLGGAGTDTAIGIGIDGAGRVCVTGHTRSADFPISQVTYDDTLDGTKNDVFCTWWTADGRTLLGSTFLGGPSDEYDFAGVGFDDQDRAYVGGSVAGAGLPVGDVTHDATFNGGPKDGWIAVLEPPACSAPPVSAQYGAGKPGTNGTPDLSDANDPPAVGDASSAIVLSNALPGAPIILFLGLQPANLAFDEGTLLVTPLLVFSLPPAGPSGTLTIAGAIPDEAAICGVTLYHQVMVVDPGATGFYQTAQSNGLARTFGSR